MRQGIELREGHWGLCPDPKCLSLLPPFSGSVSVEKCSAARPTCVFLRYQVQTSVSLMAALASVRTLGRLYTGGGGEPWEAWRAKLPRPQGSQGR